MRVLFQTYDLAFLRMGGGERVMLSLQKALREIGIIVEIFNPWEHRVDDFSLVHYFSARQTEQWTFHKENFSIPLVVTPTLPVVDKQNSELRRSLAIPDLLFAATKAEADFLASYSVEMAKVRILPNGIEPHILSGNADLAWSKIGGRSETSIILCVGRFEKVKNQHLLLQAIRQCGPGNFIFVGDADPGQEDYLEYCRKLAREVEGPTKKVHFWPRLRHEDPLLAAVYAAAAVYVQPSLFETFGIAALEAYGAGCSLALSNGMASGEIFSAKFFDPRNVDDCAQALQAALKQGKVSRRKEVEKFTWNGIALQLRSFYAEVLKHGISHRAE